MEEEDDFFHFIGATTLGPHSMDGAEGGLDLDGYLSQLAHVCAPEAAAYVVMAYPQMTLAMRVLCGRGGCGTPAVAELARLAAHLQTNAPIPEALSHCLIILQHPEAYKRCSPAVGVADAEAVERRIRDLSSRAALKAISERSSCTHLVVAIFFNAGKSKLVHNVGGGCPQLHLLYSVADSMGLQAPGVVPVSSDPECAGWIAQAQRLLEPVAANK